ncbi:hypothetical protein [Lysobacter sp. CA196]|uniref:hypothetical protein n=1 Tax=Lysobacter sp. CA196 TaxID=3455606 RepID=UPI003F8D493E
MSKPDTVGVQYVRARVFNYTAADLPSGSFVPALKLPMGTILVDAFNLVETPSNAGAADVLDVGTVAAPASFLDNADFKTAGRTPFAVLGGPYPQGLALGVTRTAAGTTAFAGRGSLVVHYVVKGVADEVYG